MNECTAVLRELDALIARRSILDHPFYQAWTRGELTREQLAAYAAQYYPHVAAFPSYLEKAIAGSDDAVIRAELLANLREEEGVPKPHPELWLDFARGLGADPEAIVAAPPTAATGATVASFDALCAGPTVAALTALYCYESQQPAVAETKAEGLRRVYGVEDDATLAYFTVHQEADLRHREGERQGIGRCLEAGASEGEVLAAANAALDAYWNLLDGVCEATGVACVH